MVHSQRIRNQLFYNSIVKLVVKAVEIYRQIDKTNLSSIPMTKIMEVGSGNQYTEEPRVGYELVTMKDVGVFKFPEFNECMEIITNDEVLSNNFRKLFRIGSSTNMLFNENTLSLFCARGLESYDKKIDYKPDLLESYLALERIIYEDRIPMLLRIPIHNIKFNGRLDVVGLGIDPVMTFKRLSLKEKEYFFNMYFLYGTIPLELFHFEVMLELKYNVYKKLEFEDSTSSIRSADHDGTRKIIDCLIYSLEILGEGCFELLGSFRNIDMKIPDPRLGFASMVAGTNCSGNNYDLDLIDPSDLKELFDKVNLLTKQKMISNAMEWFHSYTKERDENKKVIFITIMIET